MKTSTARIFIFACFLPILALFSAGSGCSTPPDQRTQAYQTLAAIGTSAKAGLDACAVLLKNGDITVEEWRKVAAFYSNNFQPAFSLAVNAAQSNLSTLASPDLVNLANQFASIVTTYTTRKP